MASTSFTSGFEGWRAKKVALSTNYVPVFVPMRTPRGATFKRKMRTPNRVYVKTCVSPNDVHDEAVSPLTVRKGTVCSPLHSPPLAHPSPQHPISALGRRRAGQRWSALVSAPTARVSKMIRPLLGESLWLDFLDHVTEHYKPAFIDAFDPPSRKLCCVGPGDGCPCPRSFHVNLSSHHAASELEHLHIDHEQDVQITCDMWARKLRTTRAANLARWDDGIDGGLLCHLLFGVRDDPVYGPAMLRFRCGPVHFGSECGYCHKLNMPHYQNLREVGISCEEHVCVCDRECVGV